MAQTILARALPNQLGPKPDRFVNAVLSDGVWDLAGGHFKVVEQAAPGMSVRCGSGTAGDMAVITGAASDSGVYIVRNEDGYVGSGNTDLSIGNGDPSDPRIDLVVLRVYDDEMDSSGLTVAQVEVVPGTPAASPSAPATPAGAYALASILVPVGESTSIDAGDITDLRGQALVGSDFHDGHHTAASAAGVVVGTAENTTSTSHATASRVVAGTITIPAGWGDYTLVLEATFALSSTSGTARRMDASLTFNGSVSTVRSTKTEIGSTATFNATVHQLRRWTGQTATGTLAFSTTLTLNATDSSVNTDEVTVVARAYRTA